MRFLPLFLLVLGMPSCSTSPGDSAKDAGNDAGCCSDAQVPDGTGADAPADSRPAECGPLTWTRLPGSPAGKAIAGSGPKDVWVLTDDAVMRGDGAKWREIVRIDLGFPDGGFPVLGFGMWVSGPNDVLVAGCVTSTWGHGVICHWDGASWKGFSTDDNRQVQALWGTAPDDVWGTTTLGNGYLGHWDGATWSHVDSAHDGVIAGGARGDFWVAGVSILTHYASGKDVAFVDITSALGVDASTCSASSCFNAGWSSGTNDVWFVADGGRTLHFDGANWAAVPTPTQANLRGVWGSSKTDAWAVGDGGVLLHFDGSSWSVVASPTRNDLTGVWSSGPCDAWAVGDAIYHGAP